ncbi:MAG: hypothetical protein WCE79_00455, partial [Xanthobacteraceae bacterium]
GKGAGPEIAGTELSATLSSDGSDAGAGIVAVVSACGAAGGGGSFAGAVVIGIQRSAIEFAVLGCSAGAACFAGGAPAGAASAMAGETAGLGCEMLPVGSGAAAGAGRGTGLLSREANASAGEIVTRGGST